MIDPNARDSLGEEVQDMLKGWLSANGKTGLGCINGVILKDLINEKLGRRWVRRAPPKPKKAVMSESEWWASLRADPANRGLDLDQQRILAESWIAKRTGRRFTRLFFQGWLERADRPVSGLSRPSSEAKKELSEPAGWYATMKTNYPDWIAFKDNPTPSWSDLTSGQKEDVCRIMKQ